MRHRRRVAIAAVLLATAAPAFAGPTEDLKALTDDYWAFVMRENPTFATQLGIRDDDDRLPDISLAGDDRRATAAAAYLARVDVIPDARLSQADRINKAILKRGLANRLGRAASANE